VLDPEPIETVKQVRFHRANVLVVDDVEDNRSLLRECFADTELVLFEAENGLEAVNKVKEGKIDLVLMDIRMPVMDGYQASETIKSFSTVPIIALTASVMQDDYERAKSTHFDGYLRKPVLKADLIKEIIRFLPYEAIEEAVESIHVSVLSQEQLLAIPSVIVELEKLVKTCEQISRNNNMSEISKFAEAVLAIGHQYSMPSATDYALQLITNIDCFDIVAIKQSLNAYPQLLEQLSIY
jgi:two-component system sensor histidine kinase EvgS